MDQRRRVILVTDGDDYARKSLEIVAKETGCRCISGSHGNPSTLSGPELVKRIKKADQDPILAMFDDSGYMGEGAGERALKYVATHKEIEVLGVIAVASRTRKEEWTRINISIDREGNITEKGVDKYGIQEIEEGRLYGDTVYCLDELNIPIVVGIGDPGKMAGKDDYEIGSPITKRAVELILERSGFDATSQGKRKNTNS